MTELFGTPEWPPGSTEPHATSAANTSGNTSGSGAGAVVDTAKEQARDLTKEGVAGGKHVASVATGQAKTVASEAGTRAKKLLDEAKSELLDQATTQQKRLADQLHSVAEELGSMASHSDQDGPAAAAAQQASQRVGSLAHWLSEREPGSLVGELKGFAAAKPGTFLAAAVAMGLFAGRMTRGVKAGPAGGDAASPSQQGIGAVKSSAVPPAAVPPAAVPAVATPFPVVAGMGAHPDRVGGEPFGTPGLAP